MNSSPVVFIVPVSGCNSLGIVRSFGRRGITPYVFTCGGRQLDHQVSRYAKVVKSPVIEIDNEEFLEFVCSFARKFLHRPILFPVNDISLLYISQYRKSFSKFCCLPFGNEERIMTLLDKDKFHKFVDGIKGVNQPVTVDVRCLDDACKAAFSIGFPCILKPSFNYYFNQKYAKKCLYLETMEQLKAGWDSFQIEGTTYIIQEIIPGKQIRGWTGYYDRSSKVLAHCSYKKVRQFPSDFGVGTLFRTSEEPELFQMGDKILSILGYHGIVDVEFKYDQRDSLWKIIEINPRTCMHNSLAAAAGVDLEFIAYSDVQNISCEENSFCKKNVLWTETHKDFASFVTAGTGLFSDWFSSRRGQTVFAYFAKDDPIPFLVRINDFFSTVLGVLFKKFKTRATTPKSIARWRR
jgi:predicted ATP-grasp superfamily ATP-dependent carboligase